MLNKWHYKHFNIQAYKYFVNMFICLNSTPFKKRRRINVKMNKGFTLLEVIFAIFVISIGVLSAYSVIQKTISEIYQSSLHLTAAYLVQEGVEIVRNKRDANWSGGAAWNSGLGKCDGNNFYQADYNDPDLGICGNTANFITIINGYYCYGGSYQTPFIREIRITPDSADKLIISVKVFWKYKGDTKGPITVQENLYKWRQ